MTDYFPPAVDFVISLEGGINSNPSDRGGLTKYGISQKQYPTLDIKALTYEQACNIYRRDYWLANGCGNLRWAFALALFDAAIQHGDGDAVTMFQNALRVKSDGVLGPVTLKVASVANVPNVLADFMALRCVKYSQDKQMAQFGRGWFKRLFLIQAKCLVGG